MLISRGIGGLETGDVTIQEAATRRDLGGVGPAGQRRAVGKLHTWAGVRLTEQPPGKGMRLLVHERIVHPEQGLRRHGRRGAVRCRRIRIRAIEEREERMAAEAGRHQVDASLGALVNRHERTVLAVAPGVHRRERMTFTGARVEPTRNQKQAVADLLGIESATAEPPEQRVARIDGDAALALAARPLVGL